MMVINHHPTERGRTAPLAGPHHQPGEVLLYASNRMGPLLVVTLILSS
jgi:hypothetical protein